MSAGPYRLMVSLDVERHEILVVGGGPVASRKVTTLLGCGSRVLVVSPEVTEELAELARAGRLVWERRAASEADFASHRFAVLAAPREACETLAAIANANGCAVDICAAGNGGDFALCGQFEAEGYIIGVSGGGKDPAGAARTKRRLMKSMKETVTVLTRGSRLAMIQAEMWREALARAGVNAALKAVESQGDKDRRSDLSVFGFGAFVKALEDEMISGNGECAIHSAKDMPAELPEGCVLAAVLERGPRGDVIITRDALAGKGIPDSGEVISLLPDGARIGTSSARRRAQILSARRDLLCVGCRGNVETRLARLSSGDYDAIVLAAAGLERLGLNVPNVYPLPFVTSAGQGAIAAETLKGSRMEDTLRLLNHMPSWYEITAERFFLSRLSAGCSHPVAVNASYDGGEMLITAEIYPACGAAPACENYEIHPAISSIEGHVSSANDAAALAAKLWEGMRESPAAMSIREGRKDS